MLLTIGYVWISLVSVVVSFVNICYYRHQQTLRRTIDCCRWIGDEIKEDEVGRQSVTVDVLSRYNMAWYRDIRWTANTHTHTLQCGDWWRKRSHHKYQATDSKIHLCNLFALATSSSKINVIIQLNNQEKRGVYSTSFPMPLHHYSFFANSNRNAPKCVNIDSHQTIFME